MSVVQDTTNGVTVRALRAVTRKTGNYLPVCCNRLIRSIHPMDIIVWQPLCVKKPAGSSLTISLTSAASRPVYGLRQESHITIVNPAKNT